MCEVSSYGVKKNKANVFHMWRAVLSEAVVRVGPKYSVVLCCRPVKSVRAGYEGADVGRIILAVNLMLFCLAVITAGLVHHFYIGIRLQLKQ